MNWTKENFREHTHDKIIFIDRNRKLYEIKYKKKTKQSLYYKKKKIVIDFV